MNPSHYEPSHLPFPYPSKPTSSTNPIPNLSVVLSKIKSLKIAPVDQNTIEQTLNLPYRDYEDAPRMIAALQMLVDDLLTRNVRKICRLPWYLPSLGSFW